MKAARHLTLLLQASKHLIGIGLFAEVRWGVAYENYLIRNVTSSGGGKPFTPRHQTFDSSCLILPHQQRGRPSEFAHDDTHQTVCLAFLRDPPLLLATMDDEVMFPRPNPLTLPLALKQPSRQIKRHSYKRLGRGYRMRLCLPLD